LITLENLFPDGWLGDRLFTQHADQLVYEQKAAICRPSIVLKQQSLSRSENCSLRLFVNTVVQEQYRPVSPRMYSVESGFFSSGYAGYSEIDQRKPGRLLDLISAEARHMGGDQIMNYGLTASNESIRRYRCATSRAVGRKRNDRTLKATRALTEHDLS
jgi:hypothetical protein